MVHGKLLHMVAALTRLVNRQDLSEADALSEASTLMKRLVAVDDWLPDDMAQPDLRYYRQYLLYGDPLERFSLVSFVWGPGQRTPVHDHTVWGVIGMLRGAEIEQRYRQTSAGLEPSGPPVRLEPGEVGCVSPTIGDVHLVSNAFKDRVSISIHLYGGNIGQIQRSAYRPDTWERKAFVSGYSNSVVPNLWASAVLDG